ncbi:MAG: DUF4846 domain-containing protein [bacterium]
MKLTHVLSAALIILTVSILHPVPLNAQYAAVTGSASSIGMIPTPFGYERIPLENDTYPHYVRQLPLKPSGSDVISWDDQVIHDADSIHAVIDWPKPTKVQQCADVAIRLNAGYLRKTGNLQKIKYKSLSGVEISYTKWLNGKYSLSDTTHNIVYKKSNREKEDTGDEFEKYLHFVMTYANSSSLARDLKIVSDENIFPGNIFIQPDSSGKGGVGHVSVVLDICENTGGEKLYLFGYGFIPAQDFHLPLPASDQGTGKWFTIDGFKDFVAHFGKGNFHRFD